MKKIKLIFVFFFCSSNILAALPKGDVVLRAMNDEIVRNVTRLKMKGFKSPYFIAYTVRDTNRYSLMATLGALITEDNIHIRLGNFDVRVGTYKFDNSNFANLSLVSKPLAVEDDYDAIRNTLWLYTDAVYKHVLETLSKKKAYRERKNITEKLDDFVKMKPNVSIQYVVKIDCDKKSWAKKIRKISAVFKKYPQIKLSTVKFDCNAENKRYVNTEGSVYRYGKGFYRIAFDVVAQAKDGLLIQDKKYFLYHKDESVPEVDYFLKEADKFAKRVLEAMDAPSGDVYVGPVIFKGQASSIFFQSLLAKNLGSTRDIWTESDKSTWMGKFNDRLDTRVMSSLFDVTSDPTIEKFDGKYLFGYYVLDDQAVKAQKVELIKKGKLVDLLVSRAPTKKRKMPNGHGRGFYFQPIAQVSNLIIKPSKTLTDKGLEDRLIQRCKELDLDYGIVIEAIPSPRDSFYAYKIFVSDGRKELVKGFEFSNLSLRSLRDISAASDKMESYPVNLDSVAGSIVAPNILVEEIELKKTQRKPEKFPLVKNPL
ncbi:MAG TPA: metallopeptidase TldD-related protein [Elusimicrobiales bacterium]|nr:metallopeptidase TldD-related protein [Elusimicrobiales bacterium]